ncbi:GNAT family N-acetyltransferase [Pseudomonas sp. NyZ704]|nr:GNAT family N-acetyltransferase [Pseudomonas sp. NyZ704]
MDIEVVVADYLNKQHGTDIVTLLNVYAEDPMGGGEPLSSYTKENLVAHLAKLSYAFSLISYVGKEPAGLINCFYGFSSFSCKPLINIHDIVVLDRFRGHGISQLMLAEVERIAREKGCCKITLEVLEGNIAAQQAYLKYGFAGYELDPMLGKALFWQKSLEST